MKLKLPYSDRILQEGTYKENDDWKRKTAKQNLPMLRHNISIDFNGQEITHQATATNASTIFSRCYIEYFLDYLSQLLYVLCFQTTSDFIAGKAFWFFFYRKEHFSRKYRPNHCKVERNITASLQTFMCRISFATCPRKHFPNFPKE